VANPSFLVVIWGLLKRVADVAWIVGIALFRCVICGVSSVSLVLLSADCSRPGGFGWVFGRG
jgi:hypothetical protein